MELAYCSVFNEGRLILSNWSLAPVKVSTATQLSNRKIFIINKSLFIKITIKVDAADKTDTSSETI